MTDAQKILNTFIKNCDSVEDAFKRVQKTVKGELNEFTAKGLNGYMAYGNSEVLIYVDGQEETEIVYVDVYGGRKSFTWG